MTVKWEKVYVFISSTFNDMHAERDYLVKQVFPRLQEWCERRKLRLVDIDLRWGVTEADASQNKRVVQVCLERIDACRPFFLCFLGQRRGWVPDRGDISPETFGAYPDLEGFAGDTSVTELEILHAFVSPLHRGAHGRAEHSFFYLRGPEYLASLPLDPPQVRAVYTNEGSADPGKDDAELRRWRDEEIPKTRRPVHPYEARWDAGASTPEIRLPLQCPSTAERGSAAWEAALRRWSGQWAQAGVRVDADGEISDPAERERAAQYNARLTRGRLSQFTCDGRPLAETILADLQAAIAARYPQHVETAAQTPLQRELDQQAQFLQAAGEGFIERQGDFSGLDGYLQDDSDRPFFLTAPAGLGKTSLLARWIDRVQNDLGPGESLHTRFIGASDGSTTVDALLRSLLGEIREVAAKIEEEIPADPNELRAALPALLEAAGKRGKTVLVLDGLNQLESGLADLGWLPLALPAGVKLIASFKRGEEQGEAYNERLRAGGQAVMAEARPFESLDDRRRLVRAYLAQFLKELDERHLEALIRPEGAGNPLYLKVVLAELRVFGAFADLGAKMRGDFGTTPVEAFTGLLRRLEGDPAYSPVRPELLVPRLFGWLAHARTGLTVEELGDLLVREGLLPDDEAGRQRASEAVHGLLRQVRPYLSRREGRIDFFYESFELAARERYVNDGEQENAHPESRTAREWHAPLAEYFDAQPLRLGADQAPNRHKLAELAYQLAHAGMAERLQQTLWDYWYMVAQLEGSGIEPLVADYDLANLPEAGLGPEARQPLRLLQGALRLSAHVLSRDAHQFPSQLTGRLLGSAELPVKRLLDQVRKQETGPWLRLLTPTLPQPGGYLIRTVGGGYGTSAMAVTPDGQRAVSGSRSGTLKVWDLETGAELHTLRGHTDRVDTLAVTPDGRRAVSGSSDKTLKVWDLESGLELATLRGHTAPVTAVAVTPDGGRVISGSSRETLLVWDLERGEVLRTLHRLVKRIERAALGQAAYVRSVAVTSDGRRAVSVLERRAMVFDLETGKALFELRGHLGSVGALALTPDGRRAVSSSTDDSTLKVWDLETGKELRTLPRLRIDALTVTPDGRRVVIASRELKVLDLETGTELATLGGRIDAASLAATADGLRVVSASTDGTLKVWDISSVLPLTERPPAGLGRGGTGEEPGKELATLRGHKKEVTALAVTPDGLRAVSGSPDCTLKVWDLETGKELRTLHGHRYQVIALAVTPDGRRAVSGSDDKTLKVWDLETGKELATLRGHTGSVQALAVTPDGRRAVSGSREGELRVWDLEGGAELHTLRGHTEWVWTLAVTPDGKRAVSGSSDKTLKVWDLERGKVLRTLRGHTGSVQALAVTPDGQRVVSGSDKTLKVWDLETGKELATLRGHTGSVQALAVTPDGRRAVSGAGDHTLGVWDLERWAELRTLHGHEGWVKAVAVTPDGRRAVSGSHEGELKVWDLETGADLCTLRGHTAHVGALALTPDGQRVVSASSDKTLRVWDISSVLPSTSLATGGAGDSDEEPGKELATRRGHTGSVQVLAVTPHGQRAVSGSNDKTLKVWNLDTGAELCTLRGHENWIAIVAVSPDGQRAVSGLENGELKVWDLGRGAELHTLHGHTERVWTLAVTPDGRRAVSGSEDKTLRIWDLDTGKELRCLRGHTERVWNLAVTPDGRRVVSASPDKTLKVWNLETGKELRTLRGHEKGIAIVAVTPDGQRVASGSGDRTLKLWDLETGKELATLRGHTGSVMALAVTPDGLRAVSGSENGELKVWDLDNGVELRTLRGHTGRVSTLAVTPDGRRAVSGPRDDTLRVWDLETGQELATFTDEGTCYACGVGHAGARITAGGSTCQVHFLWLEGVAPGPAVVTAWRVTRNLTQRILQRSAPLPAFHCPHCRTWPEVPGSALGTELPCPDCGKPVKLNPFVIEADWRPVAAAWQGEP